MFELKPLSPEAVTGALSKAERYRLLNEPAEAESICRDILAIDPDNQPALKILTLALTDQIPKERAAFQEALVSAGRLEEAYDRVYYAGIAWERRAKARLDLGGYGAHVIAHEWYLEAMRWYEKAEVLRPHGNDDSLLRWNTCARFLNRHPAAPHATSPEMYEPQLLE